MTFNIYDAMQALIAVEETIEITAPTAMRVRKAWLTMPPASMLTRAAMPCFTNSFDFIREERMGKFLRSMSYAVEMRLHVAQAEDGDNSKSAEIAIAFLDPILTAFAQRNVAGIGGVQLVGNVNGVLTPTVTNQNLRGGSPTLAVMGDGNNRTIGLRLVMEMEMKDAADYS